MGSLKFDALLPIWCKTGKIKIEENISSISSLAPKILTKKEDLEKVQPYLDKLKVTLNAKGINNIALTGGYGSGKSTLLKTFQHWNENDFKFLNISLAAFNQTKTKENFKELYELKIKNGKTEKEAEKEISNEFKKTLISNSELEKQLEISILQQIIYKVKPSNLPESRFKRIVNIPDWKLLFIIPFCFILWISSLILLFKYNYLDNINPNAWILKNDLDRSSVFIFLIAFLGVGYFSKLVVELFSNSKINKVNLKGEIEIGDDSNKSILNEHYDEILYYFEKNDFNVVVIEDLDRFDNTNIFTKLRELNILLNNADSIRNKPAYKDFGIKFLYAVGDDLFNDKKERVKFFEYIIPVIPFINSSNANDQLKTLIKESELEENVFPKEFLSDITTFIDDIDMRLLINIFHEFVIYRNVLKADVLNGREAQLFAMITYKNIDPEDFNKLNSKEGKLYKLINEKKLYIKKIIDDLNKKNNAKNIEIQNIKKETVSDVKELRRIYINQILTKFPNNAIFLTEIKINDFIEENKFHSLIENESITYRWYRQGYYDPQSSSLNFKFSEIENEVNPDFTYKERVELIDDKHNNRIDLLQKEIEKLKIEKSEIENWDLKQIFKEVDINQYLIDFSNSGLLRNLILEGYINENYNDYISLFHEVSLTKEDKKFERNVKSGINEGFDYKLTHIDNLIDNHIALKYFGRETILNFDLLDYLGENYSIYSEKYDEIIKLLSNEKDKSIEFIDGYINLNTYITKESLIETFGAQMFDEESLKRINEQNEKKIYLFIDKLTISWSGFWEYIYLNSNYHKNKVNMYLGLIIRFSKIETLIINQNKKLLIEAVEQNPQFLSLIKKTEELNYFAKITKLFELLAVKFQQLDNPTKETKELFDFVYNNSSYEINKDNLLQMIKIYGVNNNLFETSNYSTILNSNCKPLTEYINSEIDTYVKNVYLKLEQNKFEEEDSLKKLLNNKKLEGLLLFEIIEKIETKISDLSTINNKIVKGVLLRENKVVPEWNNVIDYYIDCENKIDEKLVNFLNFENVYSNLAEYRIPNNTEKFNNEIFEIEILKNKNITDESYIKLVSSCNHKWKNLDFKELNENKVIHLINERLATTKENYNLLRELFANNHIKLIEKDFNRFIKNIDDFETDEDDILLLLKSDNISFDNRFNYISKLSEQIIIDNKDIAKKVGEFIIQKSTKIEFEFDTVNSIVKNSILDETKVRLINLYFSNLSNDNIISLVKNINWEYSKLFKKGKPTFLNRDYNNQLFENLKSKQIIKNHYPDSWNKDQIRVTTIY
jgi:ABC-type lipoprotein export system ATPase subunit